MRNEEYWGGINSPEGWEMAYRKVPEDPFVIDFRAAKTWDDIFWAIKDGLGLPRFCGHNLDAVFDLADALCDYPVTVEVYGLYSLPKAAQEVDLHCGLRKVFDDVHARTPCIEFVYID